MKPILLVLLIIYIVMITESTPLSDNLKDLETHLKREPEPYRFSGSQKREPMPYRFSGSQKREPMPYRFSGSQKRSIISSKFPIITPVFQ